MKRNVKRIIFLALVFVIAAIICVPVFAVDSASSGTTTVTVNGYTYTFYSYIQRWNERTLCARVSVMSNSSVPIGYIGTQARMYNESGALVGADDWSYNSVAGVVGMDTPVYVTAAAGTYYYSKGQVRCYNGDGYSTYTSKASPYMSLTTNSSITALTINENGELYGSEIFLDSIGIKPDLIYAIGENEIEGYVKATDLEGPVAETPAEAVQQVPEDRTIPLYESDGTTIIGIFVIQNNTFVQ